MLDYLWVNGSEESVFFRTDHDHKWMYWRQAYKPHINSRICHMYFLPRTNDVGYLGCILNRYCGTYSVQFVRICAPLITSPSILGVPEE